MERLLERIDSIDGESDKTDAASKNSLTGEQAYAVQYTNRHPWSDFSVLQRLTPERLADILRDVRAGECPADFLELAQDMEIKDLHYRSVVSTRKDAVCALPVRVIPASDDKASLDMASAIENDIIKNRHASFVHLVRDLLDGLAKGFSVCEIIWDTTGKRWKPASYKWRDPRWFQYDKETGTKLMLRDELNADLHPLLKNKFIVHEPHIISGPQIASGFALPATFYFMLKSYDVTSWAAFIDRYGFPIRLAKYGRKATADDIKTLKRAVASIGADFGAVVPESAQIEIIESKTSHENSDSYQSLATWIDKQLSKLVLGQTMTTDDGSSKAQASIHEEVRQDIADADSRAVADTINTMLVVPYINMNFGEQESYPEIQLYKPNKQNVEQVINAVRSLGPQGFIVKADEVRTLLGLSKPDKDDETIGGVVTSDAGSDDTEGSTELNAAGKKDDEDDEGDYTGLIPISDDIAEIIEKATSEAIDFESFKKELEKLAASWSPAKIAELMAVACFKSRAEGNESFEG